MNNTTIRYTACFTSGEPYYPDGKTFATLAELKADLTKVTNIEVHMVELGEVEVEDGRLNWRSWRDVATLEVGDYTVYTVDETKLYFEEET